MFARRPGMNRRNIPPIGALGAPAPVIPSVLTLAGGCVAWWDSDYSSGIADGATLGANAVNRIVGSNAVLAPTGGSAGFTYSANKWRAARTQTCWVGLNTSMRATGSDIVNAANGLSKQWMVIWTWVPRMTAQTTQYAGGWDLLAGAAFSKSAGITRCTTNRTEWGVSSNATETIDSAVFNQNAQMLEISRPGGNQIQVGIDNVRTAAVTWGSGITYTVDGFTIGGWTYNNSVGTAQGDAYYRAVQVFNRIPNSTELAAIYAYNAAVYSGFETKASLGAV